MSNEMFLKNWLESIQKVDSKQYTETIKSFVTDSDWQNSLLFDGLVNFDVYKNLTFYIKEILQKKWSGLFLNSLIQSIREQCLSILNCFDNYKLSVERWAQMRKAYAYYGFIEAITEGSIVTNKILEELKCYYGEDSFLSRLSNLDRSFANLDNLDFITSDEYSEIEKEYLVMKYWQNNQNKFHDEVLYPKFAKARNSFKKNAIKNRSYLASLNAKDLLLAFILDCTPIVSIEFLTKFINISTFKAVITSTFGGKNYGLILLKSVGVNVPETYCISVNSTNKKKYLGHLDISKEKKWAVRSSATVEDNEKQSFAGMFTSYLDVEYDDISSKIEQVKESINSKRVIDYTTHFHTSKPHMSVVLQEFRMPQKSGIWMGQQVNNGYMEWINGVGELIVSGKVTPNSEKWFNNSDNPNYLLASGKYVGKECLNIQATFNRAADIEWCIVNDELIFLQFRPVTTVIESEQATNSDADIVGIPASSGITSAKTIYIDDLADYKPTDVKGKILLADCTEPDWVPYMIESVGIITADGGFLCHAAIISRELGIPCITGIGSHNLERLVELESIFMDGKKGLIKFKN